MRSDERPKITVSKETTYILEPLRPDGYVDYIAAINRRCSEGVTPENNAAVPFCRALGPKKIDSAIRKRFFEFWGFPSCREEGAYLVAFHEFFPEYDGSKSAAEEVAEDPSLAQEISEQFDRVQHRAVVGRRVSRRGGVIGEERRAAATGC